MSSTPSTDARFVTMNEIHALSELTIKKLPELLHEHVYILSHSQPKMLNRVLALVDLC
jgi:hypothetical protein